LTTNSFSFVGSGSYSSGSNFLWEFGNYASSPTATTETVNDIVFNNAGVFPVTYSVQWNDCEGQYTDYVTIHQEPNINFGIDSSLHCAPQTVHFIDSSSAEGELLYLWDFGDGNSSTLKNPSNVYENPGNYDVSLQVSTTAGCVTTLTMNKPGLITVYPSPIADFTVFPEETTAFAAEVEITDQSTGSMELFYQLNADVDTTARNLNFYFAEGGYHYPYQVVTNEYGCTDTAVRQVYVKAHTTFYVPTSFTPDNSNINDVFQPVVFDVQEYEFTIYNRWGELIYITHNTGEGWDGYFKNLPSPDGVYIWKMKFLNHLELYEEHYGNFSLIR